MTAPATPVMGIRLRGGALIPPAPSFGLHRPVTAAGARLGATVELRAGEWVAVCGTCRARLDPRTTRDLAAGALYGHWNDEHKGAA